MMQPTDLRKGNDLATLGWLDESAFGAILAQRKMRARAMVIVQARSQDRPQVHLVQDDHVIQNLSPDRAEHALDEWALPRRSRRDEDFSDTDRETRCRIRYRDRGSCIAVRCPTEMPR